MSHNLFEIVRARFPASPDAPFLLLPEGGSISYSQLLPRTARLANLFRSRGVKPGDRLAVQVEKSADALLVYLAALRAGAVYLPLNPAYTQSELRYFL
ncbi:MAG: AMP-binding protein, partial [Sphingomonadales bacterium]